MNLTMSIFMTEEGVEALSSYVDGMAKRTSREEILPILQRNLQPLVDSEKSFLSSHTVSGALGASLSSRISGGTRDKTDTMTAFSAPTATTATLEQTWRGPTARSQQRSWALKKSRKARQRVFYGPIVHQGHRIVKRNAAGQLYDTGERAAPVPFAAQAMDALGEEYSEKAAGEIMDHILGRE